jgi:hypothetical protein
MTACEVVGEYTHPTDGSAGIDGISDWIYVLILAENAEWPRRGEFRN